MFAVALIRRQWCRHTLYANGRAIDFNIEIHTHRHSHTDNRHTYCFCSFYVVFYFAFDSVGYMGEHIGCGWIDRRGQGTCHHNHKPRLWPSLYQADNLPTERPTKERERSTCYENNAKFIWSNDIRCASVHILTIHIYVRQNRTTQTLSSNANYIQFNHTEMDDNTKFYWLKEEEKKTNRQSIRRFIYVGVWPSLEINY